MSYAIEKYGITLLTYQDDRLITGALGGSMVYMVALILLMSLLFGLVILWTNHAVNRPIRRIMEGLEKVRAGDRTVRIHHEKKDEFSFIYDSFNAMVQEIEDLIRNVQDQQVLLQNAELRQLQSQINPHFLYNSFYNIKFLAHNEEYEQIETFVTALARYYRFINKEKDLHVALHSEAAHMENYVEIQQMRFGDKITVEKQDPPAALADFKVPKLILQPIVENAYNYGLHDKLADGRLTIRYAEDGAFLLCVIEDNGGALTAERLQELRKQINTFEGEAASHAMTNVNRRLMLAYGEGSGLLLDIGEAGGLRVTLKINTRVQL